MLVEDVALVREFDGGHDERLPGELAEFLMSQGHAADGAGNADDAMAVRGVALS